MASNRMEEDGRSAPDQRDAQDGPPGGGVLPKIMVRGTRQAHDTVAGCEASAASDLARSKLMDTRNGRLKLEKSAASWAERARLLARLLASFTKREALDRAESDRARAVKGADSVESQDEAARL